MSEKIYRVQMNRKGMPNFSTAVEIADRPRGEWIDKGRNLWECSNCEMVIYSESKQDRNEFHKWCSRCGARMKGADDDKGRTAKARSRDYGELEADRKTFARVSEIDEAMNEVKRCSRLCGKTKDGLGYLWYGNIISAMRKALELYDNKAATPQTETQTETQNSNDEFPSSLEDWEDEYTEHDRVDCSWK